MPKQEYGLPISLAQAKRILDAAESAAAANDWSVVMAVADSGGHLVAMLRMDGAHLGSISAARLKAKTAVNFKCTTKIFEDAIAGGGVGLKLLAVEHICPIEGGLPLFDGNRVIGAIGVSGARPDQDGTVAAAGAAVLAAKSV
jgi:glc operon protein GlcG